MGIFFNKKSKSGNTVNTKRIADSDLSDRGIRNAVDMLNISNRAVKHKFKEMLKSDQHGGLTREEVHNDIQKLVAEGKLSELKAKEISKDLGLTEKRFLKYNDYSESLQQKMSEEKQHKIEPVPNMSMPRLPEKNAALSETSTNHDSEKPKNVWDILNKQKHE